MMTFPELAREGTWNGFVRSMETKSFELVIGDVRDAEKLKSSSKDATAFIHLAAQVAVTTSVTHPREDFEINAMGTFNALEAARGSGKKPVFIYASTNKVYGGMEELKISESSSRYMYKDFPNGIDESYGIDFHSPYGCSKGCGDQYVRDYHRIYGIPTVVFRQSCIYGTRQFWHRGSGMGRLVRHCSDHREADKNLWGWKTNSGFVICG